MFFFLQALLQAAIGSLCTGLPIAVRAPSTSFPALLCEQPEARTLMRRPPATTACFDQRRNENPFATFATFTGTTLAGPALWGPKQLVVYRSSPMPAKTSERQRLAAQERVSRAELGNGDSIGTDTIGSSLSQR